MAPCAAYAVLLAACAHDNLATCLKLSRTNLSDIFFGVGGGNERREALNVCDYSPFLFVCIIDDPAPFSCSAIQSSATVWTSASGTAAMMYLRIHTVAIMRLISCLLVVMAASCSA